VECLLSGAEGNPGLLDPLYSKETHKSAVTRETLTRLTKRNNVIDTNRYKRK